MPSTYIQRTRPVTYVADGAISPAYSTAFLNNATGIDMTLPDPESPRADGQVLHIVAESAGAHTVTYATGFNGGANNTATWTTGAGNGMTLVAKGGVWFVLQTNGVTLSTV